MNTNSFEIYAVIAILVAIVAFKSSLKLIVYLVGIGIVVYFIGATDMDAVLRSKFGFVNSWIIKLVIGFLLVLAVSAFFGGLGTMLLVVGAIVMVIIVLYNMDSKSGGSWYNYLLSKSDELVAASNNMAKNGFVLPMPKVAVDVNAGNANCPMNKKMFANSPAVEVPDGPTQATRNCEIIPIEACYQGCVYVVQGDVCAFDAKVFAYTEDNKNYLYYQGWYVSTGKACVMEILR